jgi:hypothetical protein
LMISINVNLRIIIFSAEQYFASKTGIINSLCRGLNQTSLQYSFGSRIKLLRTLLQCCYIFLVVQVHWVQHVLVLWIEYHSIENKKQRVIILLKVTKSHN